MNRVRRDPARAGIGAVARTPSALAFACVLAGIGIAAVSGCHEKSRTEIIVGIATDLTAPTPLASVKMQITRIPQNLELIEQELGISGNTNNIYELPGTYAIYSIGGSPDRVRIVLTATDNNAQVIVRRSAVLSLVPEKTLFVRLGVVSACVGQPDCPDGDTCIDGRCAPEVIDSSRLPAYVPGLEKEVACAGTVNYVDTSTKLPLTTTGTACANKGTCEEGICLAPLAGSFTAAKGAPLVPRDGATQIGNGLMVLADRSVLLLGGTAAGGMPVLASAETFDPATQRFTMVGSMATPRVYFGEARLRDGRVLVAGGINEGSAALTSAEIYDPLTRTFSSTVAPMHVARAFPAMTALADGRILVVGGMNEIVSYVAGNVMYRGGVASAEIYDPASGRFTLVEGSLATGRAFPHVTTLADGGVLVACGFNNGAGVATLERFVPATGLFIPATPATLPTGTTGCDSLVPELADGRLLFTTLPSDAVWVYDPAAGVFTAVGAHPASPRGTFVAVLADGRALFAGATNGSPPSKQAYLFDPAARAFAFVQGDLDVALSGVIGAPLANGDAVVVGSSSTEIFHPGPIAVATGGSGGAAGRAGGAGGTRGGAGGAVGGGGRGGVAGTGGASGGSGGGGGRGVVTGTGGGGGGGVVGGGGAGGGAAAIGGGGAAGGGASGPVGTGGAGGGRVISPGGGGNGAGGASGGRVGTTGSGGATAGAGGTIVKNGDFGAGMSPWTTRIFANGGFTGYPKLTVQAEPACLPNRVANPYFQLDVPGGADGALEQQIDLPPTPTVLSLSTWGGLDPVTMTVSLIDVASIEHVFESFTPPPVQGPNATCVATTPVTKTYKLDQWSGPVTLRFRATATGNNGTIAAVDDIVVQ